MVIAMAMEKNKIPTVMDPKSSQKDKKAARWTQAWSEGKIRKKSVSMVGSALDAVEVRDLKKKADLRKRNLANHHKKVQDFNQSIVCIN